MKARAARARDVRAVVSSRSRITQQVSSPGSWRMSGWTGSLSLVYLIPIALVYYGGMMISTMRIYILPVILLFSGCAGVKLRSWEGNRAEFCGKPIATQADYQEAAERHCQGPAKLVGGSTQATGNYTIVPAGFGGTAAIPEKQSCYVFLCQ